MIMLTLGIGEGYAEVWGHGCRCLSHTKRSIESTISIGEWGVIVEKVIKYKCSDCGELFDSEERCLEHEDRHERINKANGMLNDGHTLQEIQKIINSSEKSK